MDEQRRTAVLRGALIAVASTFVALLLHATGGAAAPTWSGVALPLVLSAIVSVALARRRRSHWRLATSIVVSQLLFHELHLLGSGIAPWTHDGQYSDHGAPSTWALHGLAAAAALLLITNAERILDALARWQRLRLRARRAPALVPVSVPREIRVPMASCAARRRVASPARTPAVLRGPPSAKPVAL